MKNIPTTFFFYLFFSDLSDWMQTNENIRTFPLPPGLTGTEFSVPLSSPLLDSNLLSVGYGLCCNLDLRLL